LLLSFEAFRRPLVQDLCPMLSLFFRPRFNRRFGPIRGDPNDMPCHGSSFISLSFHIASTAELIAVSQRPKIIAPVVKTKTIVPIQMKMAAFFSELIGVGVMTG
jgi:hypothetical protein